MTNKLRRKSFPGLSRRSCAGLALGLCWLPVCLSGAQPSAAPAAPAKAATNAPAPAEVEIPQAVFVDDFKKGKDPFYPNSNRRMPKTTAVTPPRPTPSPTGVPPVEPLNLSLKGISGNRLAIINDTTIAVGEAVDIKTGNRKVKVRCVEIRPNSVIISVDGSPERMELFLRKE